MMRPIDHHLAGWRTPPAPSHLRQRALAAARNHSHTPVRRRMEDRIWESPAIRYGWLAAASLLLILNVTMRFQDRPLRSASIGASEVLQMEEVDVGIPMPKSKRYEWTLAEANLLAAHLLSEPCFDPLAKGDCT